MTSSSPTPADAPAVQRSSALTEFILAPNPGPMSLDGTNSYLISHPDSHEAVVVDPGPLDEAHLQALASHARVVLILITHRHPDHTEGARRLHEITQAPVRAVEPLHCHGGEPLNHGERIEAAGVGITVIATPGHTSDSASFHLPADNAGMGSVLTGDTILGRGTTVLDHPDGTLADYLASLETLSALAGSMVLPAHGAVLPDIAAITAAYKAHRLERLAQVRMAVESLGGTPDVGTVTDAVYADVDPSVRRAAELSVAAQLAYLRAQAARQA